MVGELPLFTLSERFIPEAVRFVPRADKSKITAVLRVRISQGIRQVSELMVEMLRQWYQQTLFPSPQSSLLGHLRQPPVKR